MTIENSLTHGPEWPIYQALIYAGYQIRKTQMSTRLIALVKISSGGLTSVKRVINLELIGSKTLTGK